VSNYKIFVYRGPEGANEHLARKLASCIRAHGPGRLLCVYEDSRPERRFAWVEPSRLKGLLFGGMPHLSNSAPVRIAYDAWESIARQSLAIFSTQSFPLSASKTALTAQEAPEPRNLALYCPTRQSSVSQWSNVNHAEADSAGAVNGRLDQTYGFHTDEEDNPWWQVDLRQNCILDSILIHNRVDHVSISHRTFPLSILLSLDENEWTLVHTASADTSSGGLDSRPVIWTPPENTVARYVRLQVARRSMLHLVQVEVLGSPQQADPKKRSSAT
jgi:hypothetical protein